MDIEHRTSAAEKMLRPAYHDIVVPQEKFAELLEASVRIQDMTNQVNLLIINAAAEAVCTGEDNFALSVKRLKSLRGQIPCRIRLQLDSCGGFNTPTLASGVLIITHCRLQRKLQFFDFFRRKS